MYRVLFTTLLLLISSLAFGQTNYEKFKKLFEKNDTAKIKSLLSEWESTNPDDPELYTSSINFYYLSAKNEFVSFDAQQYKDGFNILDSSGNGAGFIGLNSSYDQSKVSKALNYANTGIQKFPNRLDIRLGKCYMLTQIGDYNNFTSEVIKIVDYSVINKNNWLWTENEKKENGEGFLLQTIQAYLKELYDTENDNLLPTIIQIGEATLKYYPKNVEILSTTSVALILVNQYDKAINYLKQAEQINPKDFIVLNNIAQAYKFKGDNKNALKYYKLTDKYGDEQAKQQAQQNIKQLEK